MLPQPSAASELRDSPTAIGRIGQGRRAFSPVMTIKIISWFETIIANPAISVSELETIISNPEIRFKEVGGSLGVYIDKVGMYLLRFAPTWENAGCVSTMTNEKNFRFFFALSSTCTTLRLRREGRRHLKNKNKRVYFVFSSVCTIYGCAVKVGGTSRIKINEFILYSLRFALPLDKVGCVSTMPNEKTFVFSLHCLRLALPLHLYGNKSSYYGGSRKAERAY